MSVRSEEIGSFCFKYDRSKKLKDLILASTDNAYLLSVNKMYSNNEYFGACNFFLVLNENPFVFKQFKCKDRGATEEVVDNKKLYIELLSSRGYSSKFKINNSEVFIKQDIELPKIVDRDFYIEYCFNEGCYVYTNFVFDDPPAVFRGLYANENRGLTPTIKDLNYLRDQAEISFSNVYHEVSTEYSQIKVLTHA